MKEHTLVTVELDGGIDFYDHTYCKICDATQSQLFSNQHISYSKKRFFLSGTGLNVSQDCEEADRQIKEFRGKQFDLLSAKIEEWYKNARTKKPLHVYLSWSSPGYYKSFVETGKPPDMPEGWYLGEDDAPEEIEFLSEWFKWQINSAWLIDIRAQKAYKKLLALAKVNEKGEYLGDE